MKQSETKTNIIDIIRQYSLATGIPETFVEKDIYVLKVLSVLANINYPDITIAFSGGTCISKAYNKIKRFSEDLDFCIQTSIPFSRKDKSNFRKFIISTLNQCEDLHIINSPITITDESSFFSFEIEYNKKFTALSNLRKNIKIEFKFEKLHLCCKTCDIKSMLNPYLNDKSVSINCVNIVEIMANKFSALLWRSYIKDRTKPIYSKENDPTIMRHLYDISNLKDNILTPEFKLLVNDIFMKDKNRAYIQNANLIEILNIIYKKLNSDKLFKEEYSQFVDTMCYSKEKIKFEDAIKDFKEILDYLSNT